MEIYLLKNGETVGPYSGADVRAFLSRGEAAPGDLAWKAGMDQWGELRNVLEAGSLQPQEIPAASGELAMRTPLPGTVFGRSAAGEAARKVAGAESAVAPLSSPLEEPAGAAVGQAATEKQKAFLEFMGIRVEPGLSMEKAGDLINRAGLEPGNRERMALWNVERLRLHPELFAEEIHARKEQRPAKYLEVVQKQGGAYFQKVTKAHCQVLLNHLDVQHPGWEQGAEAVKDYFFPALVEKFPKLVLPAGRGKFTYPQKSGGKAASSPAARGVGPAVLKGPVVKRDTPLKAVVRGLVYGGVFLGLLYGGQMGWSALQTAGVRQASGPSGGGSAGLAVASQPPAGKPEPAVQPGKPESAKQVAAVAPPDEGEKSAAKKGDDLGSLIADATKEAPMVVAAPKKELPMEAPEPAPKKKRMEPVEIKPPEPVEEKVAPPVVKDPKSEATLLKSMTVEFAFGPATIEAGTVLKLISKEGTLLKLRYGPDTVTVQIDQTDYADREAGKAPKAVAKPAEAAGVKPGAKGATPAPKPGGALF